MRNAGAAGPLVVVALAAALFYFLVHQIAGIWLDVALRPELVSVLRESMDDQKHLRALDPAHAKDYRRRFESMQKLRARVEVIRLNRAVLLTRFERAFVILFGLLAAASVAASAWRARILRKRERERWAERLAGWQASARRHAHELRGPLTALRLELDRLSDLAAGEAGGPGEEARQAHASAADELTRLGSYVRGFATFGAVVEPVLRRESLLSMISEFCETFASAWPNVELRSSGTDTMVCADRDQIRQVLVNLCTNASNAVAGRAGHVTFAAGRRRGRGTLAVSDDAGGVPATLQRRMFEPYVTTSRSGEGMGLGLAISRKIMVDHGGDLELSHSSAAGSTFLLTFGEDSCN